MKFNGTIFSKPQQDQLKENIGKELEKVSAKIDEVDARMLNYTGNWIRDNEYHEHDVVTWMDDGNLYEVIKAHTSSFSIEPNNTQYYKYMTKNAYAKITFPTSLPLSKDSKTQIKNAIAKDNNALIGVIYNNESCIIRVIKTGTAPIIGGIVEGGSSPRQMAFICGTIVDNASGNITFRIFSGNESENETVSYKSEALVIESITYKP